MASFIDSDTILLQIEYRYLLFDEVGGFIDDIDFQDVEMLKKKEVNRQY